MDGQTSEPTHASVEVNLGDIFREVGALKERTDILLKRAEDHEEETKAVRAGIASLSTAVLQMQSNLDTAMPVVKRVQAWEQRAIGISLIGGLFGGAVLTQIKGWFG